MSHMTTQAMLQCLPFNYFDHLEQSCQTSQLQAQEVMVSQDAA